MAEADKNTDAPARRHGGSKVGIHDPKDPPKPDPLRLVARLGRLRESLKRCEEGDRKVALEAEIARIKDELAAARDAILKALTEEPEGEAPAG
jgi:hypothetical protein